MQLVFASNNKNKKLWNCKVCFQNITIVSLESISCFEDIPETADTIEGNAILKANYVTEKYGYDCFADDGARVEAMENPVYTQQGTQENNAIR
jgi:XTP/dITP diphosphohydrolase